MLRELGCPLDGLSSRIGNFKDNLRGDGLPSFAALARAMAGKLPMWRPERRADSGPSSSTRPKFDALSSSSVDAPLKRLTLVGVADACLGVPEDKGVFV
mmetsp:Transcript_2047/g.4643  ORF Transcript_2047/g.4643 Transcript_2047/m.4643 type:complete len:99 (-) Transcript_2047:1084-1380(-)